MRARATSIALGFLVSLCCVARAATVCYDTAFQPAVSRLEPTLDGFRAILAAGTNLVDGQASSIARDVRGWRRDEVRACTHPDSCAREARCSEAIPEIELSFEEFQRRRPDLGPVWDHIEIEQRVGPCIREGDVVWFGIVFYQGEGFSGAGGVGRYDKKTKRLEVHRIAELNDVSVFQIAKLGDELFLGTTHEYECVGHPPGAGLLRHRWNENETRRELRVCGLVPSDLLVRGDEIWVATDLGLSRIRGEVVDNFVPDLADDRLMRTTTCSVLYDHLLDTLPEQEINPASGPPRLQLLNALADQRPSHFDRYLRSRTPRVERYGAPTWPLLPWERSD